MKKIIIQNKDFVIGDRNVACIGYFDGVHKGHQDLLNKTISEAERLGLKSALICFRPDPVDVISGRKNKHIFSDKERENIIREHGIDILIIISFDEELMKMDPKQFIDDYLNRMNIEELISGFDFSYGYKGSGNEKQLRRYGNFTSIVIDEHKQYGKKVSSTRIKEELSKGNIRLVDKLLGYPYYLNLKVVKVSEKGSKWLIETIKNDKNIIDIKEGDYPGFTIKDNVYFFESDIEYRKDDVIRYYVNQ
ncbi:MAG: FAD synthetase family protein [Erysipelotrichaceae bacterium]|nr:FAD synthetase family protein [Erysipelotrichaceae bacterium]